MAVSRVSILDAAFRDAVAAHPVRPRRHDASSPVRPGARLTARDAWRLFEAQLTSRLTDLAARALKARGEGFYTIGSAGHEANAVLGDVLAERDLCFLHYRSGAFFLARAAKTPGPEGAFDVLLGLVASADEPIAGGRHKVFGSLPLGIPPQTSTIASHLPKAMGAALAVERRARMHGEKDDRIVVCSFGDASANHSTAVGAIHSASWASYQHLPVPVLWVCEDNGLGISVRTPPGWIEHAYGHRKGLAYFHADGGDLVETWEATTAAVDFVRTHRSPAFLHVDVVRLLGHAGSDVEQLYRSPDEIAASEARDPLLRTARMLMDEGWCTPEELLAWYDEIAIRLQALSEEAIRRPKLRTREQVVSTLFQHDPERIARSIRRADDAVRKGAFEGELPETSTRPRHLALQINRGLLDVMLAYPEALLFGEDVARKGGVYHVTADLVEKVGIGRVFNTLLDEQSILGLAIGAGHAGLLPLPEIQYLAYLMNAFDQLRGEAGSMQYFSAGQYSNPMVVRIAGLAYQKGFGGHFHNDNGIGALRDVPGLLVGCPARPDDAVRMLRTLVACAHELGRVTVFVEPIALYMTRDLYETGDGLWQAAYPPPGEHLPVGEIGVYGVGTDLTIATFANGLWMSLRVAKRLEAEGVGCRILDLRWLSPLPLEALRPHAAATGRVLVVDECRASSGIADAVVADLHETVPGVRCRRVTGADCYIPLGAAADLVLVSEADIEAGARALLEDP